MRCTRTASSPSTGTRASWPGTSSSCRARRSISTRCSRACSSTTAGGARSSRWASTASCGSSTATPARSSPRTTSGIRTPSTSTPATGAVTYRPGMIPVDGVEIDFCPDLLGVRNWRASAYHPETDALYIPIHPTCVTGVFTELPQEIGNRYYRNRGFLQRESRVHPASGEHAGHLIAMDIDTGEILWRHSMATRPGAAALTTAGGLVVGADTDRPPVRARRRHRGGPVPDAAARLGPGVPDHLRGRRAAVHRGAGRRQSHQRHLRLRAAEASRRR